MRPQQRSTAGELVSAKAEPRALAMEDETWAEFQAFQRFKAFQLQQNLPMDPVEAEGRT